MMTVEDTPAMSRAIGFELRSVTLAVAKGIPRYFAREIHVADTDDFQDRLWSVRKERQGAYGMSPSQARMSSSPGGGRSLRERE